MKVTWLGEGGLLFDNGKITVAVDPLFSDIKGKARNYPPEASYLEKKADVIIVTGASENRFDEYAIRAYLQNNKSATVISGEKVFEKICDIGGNAVLLSPHSVWSEGGVTFYSVGAETRDRTAIGVIIDDGKKTYYVSGATLYNYDVIDDVLDLAPDGVDYAFVPISGKDCNMNAKDAADFAYEIGAGRAVPVCFGLYDEISACDFDFEDALILKPYCECELD